MARYNKIFAALDGGDTQEAVVRRAFSIAHDNKAQVLFGHVIDTTKLVSRGIGDASAMDDKKKEIETGMHRYFNRASQDECVPSFDLQVRMGKVADTIEREFIKPFNPDLVICGVRGLSSIKYAVVGSVSTHLVHNSTCDVLVVHPESIEEVPEEEFAPYEN